MAKKNLYLISGPIEEVRIFLSGMEKGTKLFAAHYKIII